MFSVFPTPRTLSPTSTPTGVISEHCRVIKEGAIQLEENTGKTVVASRATVVLRLLSSSDLLAIMTCPSTNYTKEKTGANTTNFSIERILAPDFGRKLKGKTQHWSTALVISLLGGGEDKDRRIPASKTTSLPAWIFSTRYSDRPSSGNSQPQPQPH